MLLYIPPYITHLRLKGASMDITKGGGCDKYINVYIRRQYQSMEYRPILSALVLGLWHEIV